jgi:hypothetical protein
VPGDQTDPVVLLYVHALLGEGIAAYVTGETGVAVRAVPVGDPGAVADALAAHPRVVIFERSAGVDPADLSRRAPGAVLIDVSAAVTTGPPVPEQGEPPAVEAIVHAVAGVGARHPHAS